jgi:methylated-DNA-[protein]-cysteine S-methyltransferase
MRDRQPGTIGQREFETAFGACVIAWSAQGVTRLLLPGPEAARERPSPAFADAARDSDPTPAAIEDAIVALQRFFAGRAIDFGDVDVDLSGVSPFHRRAYEAARALAWGQCTSYGAMARQLGAPGAARAVGQAMARNRVPIIIPCHRVLAGGGRIGGFSAPGGAVTKQRLLALEGHQEPSPQFALGLTDG